MTMMPNVKLTEIPTELQSRILNSLSDPPFFPSEAPPKCTVETATWRLQAFPDDLLNAAKASNALSDAVICTLGPHAKVLNFRRSKRLSEWIPILAEHIKAFSLTGSTLVGYCEEGCVRVMCNCNNVHKSILKTLKALDTNGVALAALNLEEIAGSFEYNAEEMAELVIKALQRSNDSLKEIAVNVNMASTIAPSHVTLPNLEVAQISSNDYDIGDSGLDASEMASMFGDMLHEINGRGGCLANLSKLRELRLFNIHQSPTIKIESSSTFFPGVEKLIMMCGKASKHREIAKFIANFRNMKTLQWFTGLVCPEDMSTIFAGCPNLENLELSICDRYILPGEVPLTQNSSKLKDLFVSFRGKQRHLEFNTYLSPALVKILGENCQDLRILEMEIDSQNVAALSLLLGTHCRKLRKLHLMYSKEAMVCLGRNGWAAFAQAICSASDELHEISIIGYGKEVMLESAIDEMELAIKEILKFLADRASSIVFRVPVNTDNPFTVLEVLSRVLEVAKIHCRSMKILCLDFIKDDSFGVYPVEHAEEDDLLDLFLSVCRLITQFPLSDDQEQVNIGDIDALWEVQGSEDEEDMDDEPGEAVEDELNDQIVE